MERVSNPNCIQERRRQTVLVTSDQEDDDDRDRTGS